MDVDTGYEVHQFVSAAVRLLEQRHMLTNEDRTDLEHVRELLDAILRHPVLEAAE